MHVPDFTKLRVAVLGDLIADHWLHARPARLSREAPVMVLRHERESIGAGGAANVARNLRALGAKVSLFGCLGRDASARDLLRLLELEGIDVAGVATIPGWTTPTKTRVLAAEPRRSPQQVLRIDREPDAPAPLEERARIAGIVRANVERFDALLVSDYEYGGVDEHAVAAARRAFERRRVVVLDPRADVDAFQGALTACTPNTGELAAAVGVDASALDDHAACSRAARVLLARLQPEHLLVTRGNLGMALFGASAPEHGCAVDASGEGEVTDVCGAGDTSAAVFTLALAAGCDAPRAMALANAAAGVVVMEHGTATCSPAQLAEAFALAPVPVALARS